MSVATAGKRERDEQGASPNAGLPAWGVVGSRLMRAPTAFRSSLSEPLLPSGKVRDAQGRLISAFLRARLSQCLGLTPSPFLICSP